MTQLDRIEQKLDRLLRLMGTTTTSTAGDAMPRLHPDDIKAIGNSIDYVRLAAEIVRQQRNMEEIRMDMDYLLTLPPEEYKRIQREKLMRSRRATK